MKSQATHRVYYFDNIRYFIILLVIVLHSACAYSKYTVWWPVNDQNSRFFDDLLIFLGVFLMPTLFFIAGYFALPSLQRRDKWSFIKQKAWRLGIPCLIGTILYNPIHFTIWHSSRESSNLGLWDVFLIKLRNALEFNTEIIQSANQFQQYHFWFISLLLSFFIILTLVYRPSAKSPSIVPTTNHDKQPSQKSTLLVVAITGVIVSILSLIVKGYFVKIHINSPWILIANLIQFQVVALVTYIFCFLLGLYAFQKKWFLKGRAPGHYAVWLILSIILWLILKQAMIMLLSGRSLGVGILIFSTRTFLFFSILLCLISFSIKHWNSSSRVNRLLATNSYYIYLIHMVLVVTVQFLVLEWTVPSYIKFLVVVGVSMGLSLAISELAIRRYPKAFVAGLILAFVVLLFLI